MVNEQTSKFVSRLVAEIGGQFDRVFNDGRANPIWEDITALTCRADEMDETAARQSALESLWLFEQFMLRMGGSTR